MKTCKLSLKAIINSLVMFCLCGLPSALWGLSETKAKQVTYEQVAGYIDAKQRMLFILETVFSISEQYYVDDTKLHNIPQLVEGTITKMSDSVPLEWDRSEGAMQTLAIGGQEFTFDTNQLREKRNFIEMMVIFSYLVDSYLRTIQLNPEMEDQADGALLVMNSFLGSLDEHTMILSPERYRELKQGTEGTFGGVGIIVGFREGILTVIKPLPESPALLAGLAPDDRIIAIDGVNTFDFKKLDDMITHMRGDPGSKVQLTILRDNSLVPEKVGVERNIITVDPITEEVIQSKQGPILYIQVKSFSQGVSKTMEKSIKSHRHNGVVLDLRGNPGGLLDEAVKMVDLFLQSGGTIVSIAGRFAESHQDTKAIATRAPLVILVNNESASASEIVAGTLREYDRAVILGQRSYGKGSVQTVFDLIDNYGFKETISLYQIAGKKIIDGIGVFPHVNLWPIIADSKGKDTFGANRFKRDLTHEGKQGAVLSDYYMVQANDVDYEKNYAVEVTGSMIRGKLNAKNYVAHLASKPISTKNLDFLSHQGIDWQQSPEAGAANLSVTVSGIPKTITPGEELSFNYQIVNQGDEPVSRVSYIFSPKSRYLTAQEIVIGEIPAHDSSKGTIKLKIPSYLEGSLLTFQHGYAQDSVVNNNKVVVQQSRVVVRDPLQVTTSLSYQDGQGSKIAGALEPGEQGRIMVVVKNDTSVAGKDIEVRLFNFSGKQISVGDKPQMIPSLQPGEKKVIYFNVAGSEKILEKDLQLGVFVQSDQLREPVKKSFAFSSSVSRQNSLPR